MNQSLLHGVEFVVVHEGDEQVHGRNAHRRVLQIHRQFERRPDTLNLQWFKHFQRVQSKVYTKSPDLCEHLDSWSPNVLKSILEPRLLHHNPLNECVTDHLHAQREVCALAHFLQNLKTILGGACAEARDVRTLPDLRRADGLKLTCAASLSGSAGLLEMGVMLCSSAVT